MKTKERVRQKGGGIGGVAAVRIFVSDIVRSAEFYESVFEVEPEVVVPHAYAVFPLVNTLLVVEEVARDDAEFDEHVGCSIPVSFGTSDIRKTCETLRAKGVRFHGPPEKQSWGGTLAFFYDHDENVLTLVQE